jgi:hypothetical protein
MSDVERDPKQLKNYRVTWTIDAEAQSPLDAVIEVVGWMQNRFTPEDDAFEVVDDVTGETTHIDLFHLAQGEVDM